MARVCRRRQCGSRLLVTGPVPDAKLPLNHNRKPLLKHESAPGKLGKLGWWLLWLGLGFVYWVPSSQLPGLGFFSFFFFCRQSVVATAAGRTRATPGFQGEGCKNRGHFWTGAWLTDWQPHQHLQEGNQRKRRAGSPRPILRVTDTPRKIWLEAAEIGETSALSLFDAR